MAHIYYHRNNISMNHYSTYVQRLIGGYVRSSKASIQPGNIVSFKYKQEKSNRKLFRIVLVLNTYPGKSGALLHGINLENVPESSLYAFLKQVITQDTIALIKRKYELKGPFSHLIERPSSFYKSRIKPNLSNFDCYRTYKIIHISQVKCWMLDWKKLKIFTNTTNPLAMVTRVESLKEIKKGKLILNDVLNTDISKLNDLKFKKLILDRFGDMDSFYEMIADIKKFADNPNKDIDDFNASNS